MVLVPDHDAEQQETTPEGYIRLSRLVASYATNLSLSRSQVEKRILKGEFTWKGETIRKPAYPVQVAEIAIPGLLEWKPQQHIVELDSNNLDPSHIMKEGPSAVEFSPVDHANDFQESNNVMEDEEEDDDGEEAMKEEEEQKEEEKGVRFSKLLASHTTNLTVSRAQAEKLIFAGGVTWNNEKVTSPCMRVQLSEIASGLLHVQGEVIHVTKEARPSDPSPARTRVWLVHKLKAELVTEHDPAERPTMLERLRRSSVGFSRYQRKMERLKPIGRLDMMTEGLIAVTNDGKYSREMELPHNQIHRTYRVRAHGILTPHKLDRLRYGLVVGGIRYKGMKVEEETRSGRGTNTWVRVTCYEGKNRMIRNVFEHLGLEVTRLIRISYGDYHLDQLPPGHHMEVPMIPLKNHRRRGPLQQEKPKKKQQNRANRIENEEDYEASPVSWVRH